MTLHDTLDGFSDSPGAPRWTWDCFDLDDELVGCVEAARSLCARTHGTGEIIYQSSTGPGILCCTANNNGIVSFRWPRAYTHWAALTVQLAASRRISSREMNDTVLRAIQSGVRMLDYHNQSGDGDPFDALYEFNQAVRMIEDVLQPVVDGHRIERIDGERVA